MSIRELIETTSAYNPYDIHIETKEYGEKAFNDYDIQIKGKSSYENCVYVDCLPKGTKFIVLVDEKSSNETGDFSWYFCIMIKYYGLYISLHNRGLNNLDIN